MATEPLAHLTGPHWPVVVTWYYGDPDTETYTETVNASSYAEALRWAAYIYQSASAIRVIPLPVAKDITAAADPADDDVPAVAHLAHALLETYAHQYAVVRTK